MSENQSLFEKSNEQKDTQRGKLNVLFPMVVTAAVTHFEMSALNAAAK